MDQGCSRLVIPSNCILECKNSTHTRLRLMQALAEMDLFTIRFENPNMTGLMHNHLQQIASIFSATNANRPATDDRRTNLQTLYIGIGGHVFNASSTLAEDNNEGDKALPEDTSATPPFDRKHSIESLTMLSSDFKLFQFQTSLMANTNLIANANASASTKVLTLMMNAPLCIIIPLLESLIFDPPA